MTFYENLQTRERRRRKQKGKGNRQTKYRRATKNDKQDHVIRLVPSDLHRAGQPSEWVTQNTIVNGIFYNTISQQRYLNMRFYNIIVLFGSYIADL